MFNALRRWAEEIEISGLVSSPDDAAHATPGAMALSRETIREIKAQQVEVLYKMDRGSGLKPVLTFIVTTWIVAGFSSALPWAALALYCAAWTWHHSLQLQFQDAADRVDNPEYWARRFTYVSFGTGIAWGLGAFAWLLGSDVADQAIVSLVVLGVGASSVISRAMHRRASLMFLLPECIPPVAYLVATGTTFGFMMAALGALFAMGLLQWGKSLRDSQLDSIALRFQNEALVDSLSEQRRAAEKAKDAAEAGSRTKTEFLATMSHEVRTPLNGILGMARVLQNSALNKDQKEQLGIILESGEMLNTVLNDVLDLSKLEAGQLDVEPEVIDLQAEVKSAVRLMQPGARQKGLNVEITGAVTTGSLARGDAHRVRQVLLNLIGNAIKFTDQGEVNVTVVREGSPALPSALMNSVPSGSIVVLVSDTGIGIAPHVVPELFQPFRQADQTTTRKYGGSGLGLAICKRLMSLMDGEIGVLSTPGEGSTFWFSLPAAKAAEMAAPGTASDAQDASADMAPRFILLAEDNDLNAKVAEALLGRAGHKVFRTRDGRETVTWLHDAVAAGQTLPDIILMDIRMPTMSGIEAAEAIRAMGGPVSHLPIVALTADISLSDVHDGHASKVPAEYAGRFDGVLPKPISPDHLARAIAEHAGATFHPHGAHLDDPRIDSRQLTELMETLGSKTVSELIEDFEGDMADITRAFAEAEVEGNTGEVRIRAHNLAGTAASLGFVALASAARELNNAARADSMEAITPELTRVRQAISETEELMARLKSA